MFDKLFTKNKKEDTREKIIRITCSEKEEEGGWQRTTYYPSGHAKIEGEETNRGYTLSAKPGIYETKNLKALQEIFNTAKTQIKEHPEGEEEQDGTFIGYQFKTIIETQKRKVTYQKRLFDSTPNPIPAQAKPSTKLDTPKMPNPKTTNLDWKPPTENKINNAID